jgi:Universal stress protein family
MNANDATLTRPAAAQTGSRVTDAAPNTPASGFDLVLEAVAGRALGGSGPPCNLTISAIDLTAVSQPRPAQALRQAFDPASGWKLSGTGPEYEYSQVFGNTVLGGPGGPLACQPVTICRSMAGLTRRAGDEALLAVWAYGGPRATTAVRDAERRDVASAIAWQASLWRADLIVLTCRPRLSVSGSVMGCASDQVMRQASCPALAVHPRRNDPGRGSRQCRSNSLLARAGLIPGRRRTHQILPATIAAQADHRFVGRRFHGRSSHVWKASKSSPRFLARPGC